MASSNRSQIEVESNVLVRRAAWCGIVFALAMILTFLNFLPPVSVQYHVRSKVVVSESRLGQLRDLAIADREAVKHGEKKRIQLLSVTVLDLAEQEQSADSEPTDEKVVLIEVGTLWNSRCTSERHFTWLKNISKIDPAKIPSAPAATTARFARWELEAAKHYQSQFIYQGRKETLPTVAVSDVVSGSSAQSAPADSEGVAPRKSFQLASYREQVPPPATADRTDSGDASLAANSSNDLNSKDFELQLTEQVRTAKRRVEQSEEERLSEVDRYSGTLQIASMPVISSRTTSIPFWMAASILVLGLSAGSTAGWFQHRANSGGTYQAVQVAQQLALDSVPIAGRLVIPESASEIAASSFGPSAITRAGQRLTRMAEIAVSFWATVAVCRFLFDSVWRDVLIHSPLAALGRMLAGMP